MQKYFVYFRASFRGFTIVTVACDNFIHVYLHRIMGSVMCTQDSERVMGGELRKRGSVPGKGKRSASSPTAFKKYLKPKNLFLIGDVALSFGEKKAGH